MQGPLQPLAASLAHQKAKLSTGHACMTDAVFTLVKLAANRCRPFAFLACQLRVAPSVTLKSVSTLEVTTNHKLHPLE